MSSRRAPVADAPVSRLHAVLVAGHARRAATAPTSTRPEASEDQQRAADATFKEVKDAVTKRAMESANETMNAWVKVTLDAVMPLFDRRTPPNMWHETYNAINEKYETLSDAQRAALNQQRPKRAELMQELVTHLLELAHAWMRGTRLVGFPQSHNDYVADILAKWSKLMARLDELVEKDEPGMFAMRTRLHVELDYLIKTLPKKR